MTTENTQPTTPAPEAQPEVPAETTTVSETPPPKVAPVVPPAPKYLTMEDAERLMAQAVQKAQGTDWQKIQAAQDRAEAAIRRNRELEAELNTVSASLEQIDPEMKEKLELTRYRTRERNQVQLDAEEQVEQRKQATYNKFFADHVETLKEAGIDPADKRIDWGQPGEYLTDLTSVNRKITRSMVAIQKEREAAIAQREKDKYISSRRELESVDRTPSVGGQTDVIPTDRSKIGAYIEGLTDAQYDKVYPKIKQMLDEGKIK